MNSIMKYLAVFLFLGCVLVPQQPLTTRKNQASMRLKAQAAEFVKPKTRTRTIIDVDVPPLDADFSTWRQKRSRIFANDKRRTFPIPQQVQKD